MKDPFWGIVATIKAPATDILRFVAFHLDAGAHRIFICLDTPCPAAETQLCAHPKLRVIHCDSAYWRRLNRGRPEKHQHRQTLNATHVYSQAADVDWLAHMDCDEFLVTDHPIAHHLRALPDDTLTARVRPMEQLAGSGNAFKRFIPNGPDRERTVSELYPVYGEYLKGGFLSHVAGKVFVRTGLKGMQLRIHNARFCQDLNPCESSLDGLDLAHCHAKSWEAWHNSFRYRFEKGSYRADLGPVRSRQRGGITMHELFQFIERENGEAGLNSFFQEVCADSPGLRARLDARGLLTLADLRLDATVAHHFPKFSA